MNKEAIYKNLQRYAKIVNRIDYESERGFEMIKVYFYENEFYMAKLLNGNIEEVKVIQYTDYEVVDKEVVRKTCCICGKEFIGSGNNPDPYKKEGRCCDDCNTLYVIPERLSKWS